MNDLKLFVSFLNLTNTYELYKNNLYKVRNTTLENYFKEYKERHAVSCIFSISFFWGNEDAFWEQIDTLWSEIYQNKIKNEL